MENSGANKNSENGSTNDDCLPSTNMECEDNIDMLNGALEIEFQSREDLIGMVQTYALMQGYTTSIKKSVKSSFVIIGCDRGGTYRNKLKIPMESRKRKTSSRLIDCPFKVCGRKRVGRPWVLEIINACHNHDPTVDMSGHPSCRRFSKEEFERIKEMTKSGIAPRQILSSLRQCNPNLKAISRTMYNAKAKMRRDNLGGRTMIQALVQELGANGFTYDVESDSCGHVTRLFFAHPISIALTKNYSHVFVMDCTYKTNKYKMPLLDIVGVSSFNTSFYSCFTFLQKEEVEDYVWALKRFRNILGVNCEPSAIVTDRELALMKAITWVFPTTSNILCIWHIEKNILTNCKSQFQESEDWEGFMKSWTVVINSQSEEEYNRALEYFEIQYKEKTSVLNYIKNTWLHLKEHFVCAWTEKYTHFGTRVTSRAEGAHALLKRYLQVSTGDLSEVKNKLCLAIENQFQEIKTQFESEKIRIPHHLHISLFKELVTHVSVFALNELHKQYKLVMSHEESLTCKNYFMTVMGMPCAHKMKSLGDEVLQLDDIHSQWRLDTRSFLDNDFTENNGENEICGLLQKLQERYVEWPLARQQVVQKKIYELVDEHDSFLHEPCIQPHKGRPTGSKNKKTTSTRRDPSAFEFVKKIRKCSICKDPSHDKRYCPFKDDPNTLLRTQFSTNQGDGLFDVSLP